MKSIFTFFLLIAVFVIKPATAHAQDADTGDSLALVDLYDSTGGTAWTHHTNWLTTAAVNTWYGVSLDTNGRVTSLLLNSNKLIGTIPASIGTLNKVQNLYLNSNHLSGPLPGTAFNNFTRIKLLDLSDNYFNFDGVDSIHSGITPYIKFTGQHSLSLNFNSANNVLTVSGAGGIPANNRYRWFFNGVDLGYPPSPDSTYTIRSAGKYSVSVNNTVTNFFIYSATTNKITPTINYYDSLQLTGLYISLNGPNWTDHTNWLTAAPVKTWKGITLDGNGQVSVINLSSNNLKGPVPDLYSLSGMKTLNLNDNQLYGNLDLLLFGQVDSLQDVELAHNNITGALPNSSNHLNVSHSNIVTLNLSYNQLSFSIVSKFPNLQYLYIDHNNFADGIGGFSSKQLKVIDTRYNYLSFAKLESTPANIMSVIKFEPQHGLPLHFNNQVLSVTALGASRQSYLDYSWYKDSTFLKTIVGDSTFTVTQPGHYSVIINDELLPAGFRLFSDTFEVTAAELPVKLTTFTGQLTHGQAFLNWQTATELNSSYFGVQRSIDGTNFTTVGKVAAAGTSAVTKNYQYTDALTGLATMPAALYYRLQQVDKDGKPSMSKTILLNPGANASSSLIMYPNPVRNLLNLRLKDIPGNAVITITDAGGKTLLAQTSKTVTGGQTISLNTSTLAAGVYVVHVQYNGQSEEQKFVKE